MMLFVDYKGSVLLNDLGLARDLEYIYDNGHLLYGTRYRKYTLDLSPRDMQALRNLLDEIKSVFFEG